MFDARFNNGYQNTVTPLNTDPYGDQYLNQMSQNSYTQSNVLPNMMSNNTPYPVSPSQSVPAANVASRNTVAYAGGGTVKQRKGSNPYPMLAEMIRQQGRGEDTILAHINPLEAMILKNMGGSGTINPETGLPEFGGIFSKRYWKKGAWKRDLATAVGVIAGNAILPGAGGVIGGALGGGAGTIIRGRKDYAPAMIKGAVAGAAAPTAASAAGWGAKTLGADRLGATLTNYGNTNAILPSLGKIFGVENTGNSFLSNIGGSSNILPNLMGAGGSGPRRFEANDQGSALENYNRYHSLSGVSAGDKEEQSFTDKLLGNTKDYLSQPGNLLTLASVAGSFMNRPKEKKEKTPEQQADEHKRLEKALRLSPAERADMEANLLAEEQMKRRIARQKFLPEERLGHIEPLYRRSNTPEEYKKHGKWLSYYNNPEFTGEPIPYKKGGSIRSEILSKGKKFTADIIEQNRNQHKGLLDEKSLHRDFANLTKTLGLTEEEVYALERYAENIFKDNQFTDGPGYFYNKAHGNPITMKMGGSPNRGEYFEEEIEYPSGLGRYIAGDTNGQDDKIPALLSDGEYVIPADVVAHLGDGNNSAGAKKLDMALKNIRKHKGGIINKLPPKAKSLVSYIQE